MDNLNIYAIGRGLLRRQRWTWRYQASGNNAIMAVCDQSYARVEDAVEGAFRVCGIELDPSSPSVSGKYHRHHGLPSVWVTVTG